MPLTDFLLSMRRVVHWVWFGLALLILPIFIAVFRLSINELNIIKNFKIVLSHGELLLVCMSVFGTTIGELATKDTNYQNAKICLIGISLFLALFAASVYSEYSITLYDKTIVFYTSLGFFIGAVFSCVSALILPKKRTRKI